MKLSRLWQARNDPFTLWLLSAILISVFGTTFADIQRCRSDFEQTSKDYFYLRSEIKERKSDLFKAVHAAESMADLKDKNVTRQWREYFVQLRYKGRTLRDLEQEWERTSLKLSEVPWRQVRATNAEWDLAGKIKLPSNFDYRRFNLSVLSDQDFPLLKQYMAELSRVEFGVNIDEIGRYAQAYCSIAFSIRRLVFGDPGYVGELQYYPFIKPSKPNRTKTDNPEANHF